MGQDVHFANVEFELESDLSLKPLLDEISDKISLHYYDRLENGIDFASFDLRESGYGQNIEVTVSAFCDLIEDLSPLAKEVWSQCVKRELDIGFEGGDSKFIFEGRIENKTLARVAEIGASVEITIYPISPAV